MDVAAGGLLARPTFDIYLAFDGSINSEWVARYALNMAAHNAIKKINLIHVWDGAYAEDVIARKISLFERECTGRGVELSVQTLSRSVDVFSALLQAIPPGADKLCICGARISSRGKGYLAGTISEKLLRCKQFNVFAIRVVKPGILGLPRDILFPLSGHPRGLQAAMSFFLLMTPQVKRLYLLRVMHVHSLWYRYLSAAKARSLCLHGSEYMDRILTGLRDALADLGLFIDGKVVLSDDWVKEILIYANKIKAQMIIMGASDRNLPSRHFYGNKIEQILRHSPCDVAVYRKI